MKQETKSYNWVKYWTAIYMVAMSLIFPLYYQNNYINMLEAKTAFFAPATCIYIAGGVFWILVEYLSGLGAVKKPDRKNGKKVSGLTSEAATSKGLLIQDIFFIIFALAVVISTLLSGDLTNAWIAPDCKMFGARILLLCCGIYVIVSKGYAVEKVVKGSLAAGLLAVFTLTVLNRYGIDPLDMYSNLVEHQKHIYVSTIGNVNIVANFICIFIPLIMGTFIYSRAMSEKVICGILLYTGVMAGIATNSDSFFLGFGAAIIFLLWFALDNKEKMIAYLAASGISALSMFSLKLFNSLSEFEYKWNSLQLDLIDNIPWLLIAAALVAILILVFRGNTELPLKKIRNIIFVLLGAGLMAGLVLAIRINIGSADVQSEYLTFNDEWGTNRGYVWSRTCQLFGELPFYQQLTGIGPGGFSKFFASFNADRAAMGLSDFVDPHSEALYYLVATGFAGMIGYLGMIIVATVKCIKKRSDETIILAAVFVSWLAQGTVNNPLVFVTPYIFLFLGLSRYRIK